MKYVIIEKNIPVHSFTRTRGGRLETVKPYVRRMMEGHHTLPVGASWEALDWHLRHLGEGGWETAKDIPTKEHRKIKTKKISKEKPEQYETFKHYIFEKAKRIYVPASGKQKAYWRYDPRSKQEKHETGVLGLGYNLRWREEIRRKGYTNLIGKKVESAGELAALAQIYRNPMYETHRIFMVNDDNVIVGQTALSIHNPTAAPVFDLNTRASLKEAANELKQQMQRIGATKYYLLHNHPSGRMMPSEPDISITAQYDSILPGFVSHIVIDHNKFLMIDYDHPYGEVFNLSNEQMDELKKPSIPHPVLGKAITGPMDIIEIAKNYVLNKDNYYVMLTRTFDQDKGQAIVNSIQEIPKSFFDDPVKATKEIERRALLGAGEAFIYGVADKHMGLVSKLIGLEVLRDAISEKDKSLVESSNFLQTSYAEKLKEKEKLLGHPTHIYSKEEFIKAFLDELQKAVYKNVLLLKAKKGEDWKAGKVPTKVTMRHPKTGKVYQQTLYLLPSQLKEIEKPVEKKTRNFTDEQLTKKVLDERIFAGLALPDNYGAKTFDYSGMTLHDRLRFQELIGKRKNVKEKANQAVVPQEFGLTGYSFHIRDVLIEHLGEKAIEGKPFAELLEIYNSTQDEDHKETLEDVKKYDWKEKEITSKVKEDLGKKVLSSMSADDIRGLLKELNLIVPAGTKVKKTSTYTTGSRRNPVYHTSTTEYEYYLDKEPNNLTALIDGVTPEELEEFIDIVPEYMWKNRNLSLGGGIGDENFTDSQMERLANNFDKYAESIGIKYPETKEDELKLYGGEGKVDSPREKADFFWAWESTWPFSKNYYVVRQEVLSGWAFSSGSFAQKVLQDISKEAFPINHGINFYESEKNKMERRYSSSILIEHLKRLKQETEEFYKKKLKTQDLSTKVLEVYRGIGGMVEAYTPASIESWTADKFTVDRFGKMMSRSKEYTALKATETYNNVLWSYESAKDWAGWPPDKELKGKKEFVLIGGAVKNVQAEVRGG